MSQRLRRAFRRALLPAVVVSVCAVATPASAEPLPPPPVTVRKSIAASITVTHLPGIGTRVTPGGDAALAFDCVTTDSGAGSVDVACTKDAGSAYELVCSKIDVTGVTAPAPYEPRFEATGWCADADDTWFERMRPAGEVAPYHSFLHLSAERLGCVVDGPADVAFTVTCAFSATARQPIIGGIVMSQDAPGAPVQVVPWGVLANAADWDCQQNLTPPAFATEPPTVRCEAVQGQWFCNQTSVQAYAGTATVPPPSPSLPLRVRGQLSCDANDATNDQPVPGRGRSVRR